MTRSRFDHLDQDPGARRAEPRPATLGRAGAIARRRLLVAGGLVFGRLLLPVSAVAIPTGAVTRPATAADRPTAPAVVLTSDSRPPLEQPGIVLVPLAPSGPKPDFSASVLRPRDLLSLRFDFYNLVVQGGRLVRKDAAQPAYVVVQFPPQHIGEQAFEDPGDTPLPPGQADARLAGPSRLAFELPADVGPIPYTLDGLLSWTAWRPSLAPTAEPPRPAPGQLAIPPPIAEPGPRETSIELPYRLMLSPSSSGGWVHSPKVVDQGTSRAELWHTRFAARDARGRIDERVSAGRTLRAIWSPDYKPDFNETGPPDPNDDGPFLTSLTPRNRHDIVRRTAEYKAGAPPPEPIEADQLMLSSLGAWLDSLGSWDPQPDGPDLVHWRHRSSLGRDVYVRVVYRGFYLPSRHKAVRIHITERRFEPQPGGPFHGPTVAYLRKTMHLVTLRPDQHYWGPGHPYDGRGMPFRRMRLMTRMTPPLDPVDDTSELLEGKGIDAFWPRVGGQDFLFNFVAEDADGRSVEFSAPQAFVVGGLAENLSQMTFATGKFNNDPEMSRRVRPLRGQRVAFAPGSEETPGDTTLETESVTFGVLPAAANDPFGPAFYPVVTSAAVRLSAVEQLAGKAAATTIKPHQAYLDHGLPSPGKASKNPAALFASIPAASKVDVAFEADRSGGLATPNLSIDGLSRLGPVGGADTMASSQKFRPVDFFAGADARLLGALSLVDVLKEEEDFSAEAIAAARVPKLVSRPIFPKDPATGKEQAGASPAAIETRFDWKPTVKGTTVLQKDAGGPTALTLRGRILTPIDPPGKPDAQISGELTNFKINLAFLILTFRTLSFRSRTGEKTHVDVDISAVDFGEPLSFVNKLRQYLKTNGSGLAIDLTPTSVSAGYTLALPSIAVGVFTLQNISLTAGLTIPYLNEPLRTRFAFCTRENPFCLTVCGLGGGGFFGIAIGADGVEMFEAALEFGADVSLNLGVASGGVHVMAGVYFAMDGEQASLTGYVRLGGELDILGLISMSLEFYLGLTYDFDADVLWGQATLEVEVEVLCFSASVSMSVERTFAGSKNEGSQALVAGSALVEADDAPLSRAMAGLALPRSARAAAADGLPARTFADLVTEKNWGDYALAFA